MVFESLVSTVLSYILDKYVDRIDTKSLKIALLSGKVSLENLLIKKSALIEHQLPLEVSQGLISSLFLKVPYMKLKTSPCEVEINQIFLLGKIVGRVLIEGDSASTISQYGELDASLKEQNVSSGDLLGGLVGTIINNLRVNITDIHIRVEHHIGNKRVAFGIIIPSISVFTVDENMKEVFVPTTPNVLRKVVSLKGLSIYLDTDTQSFDDSTNFKAKMKEAISSEHQFILHNFSIQGVLVHNIKEVLDFSNLLKFSTNIINLSLSSSQYRVIRELQMEQTRFNRRRFFSSCGKPNREPRSPRSSGLWWRFFYNCTIKKRNPIVFDPKTALTFLKNRKKYLKDLSTMLTKPNPKKDQEELDKLQEKFGTDVVILLRLYAKRITETQMFKDKALKLQKEELEELAAGKPKINEAQTNKNLIEFVISALKVSLNLNDKDKLATFNLNLFKGSLLQEGDIINIDGTINELLLLNNTSNDKAIFKLTKNEKMDNCCLLKLSNNKATNEQSLKVNCTQSEFFADFSLIDQIQAFLNASSGIQQEEGAPEKVKRDNTIPEIEDLLAAHKNFLVDIHFDSPSITVPTAQPISIDFGNIDITNVPYNEPRSVDKVDSYFDQFLLKITGFQIKVNDHFLCNPVEFNVSLYQSFIQLRSIGMTRLSLYIPAIQFELFREDYLSILSITDILPKNDNLSTYEEEEKQNNNNKKIQICHQF
ncbi:hypothetical protein GPJ56_004051 [Histomonas meleagridis]|uniref:uncharacterized protein n=1 Tax=Histomonas meleagridis TaxID=135588 RepID=UPI00355A979C|nr:hypothetical protein GPJ56_004051 [Histomonas meleagridis]KAH0800595.1 hypothetical protein GO595_006348 [Histomonas meleagridis]